MIASLGQGWSCGSSAWSNVLHLSGFYLSGLSTPKGLKFLSCWLLSHHKQNSVSSPQKGGFLAANKRKKENAHITTISKCTSSHIHICKHTERLFIFYKIFNGIWKHFAALTKQYGQAVHKTHITPYCNASTLALKVATVKKTVNYLEYVRE